MTVFSELFCVVFSSSTSSFCFIRSLFVVVGVNDDDVDDDINNQLNFLKEEEEETIKVISIFNIILDVI